jgi:glucose dehydrogenase
VRWTLSLRRGKHGAIAVAAILLPLAAVSVPAPLRASPGAVADWAYTEGAPGGGRYSPLDQIDRSNVGQL